MTYLDAFIIGTVQGFAVLPGLSRSASRSASGCCSGFTGRWAADYTFLLAIPAIVGAAGVEILSALRHQGAGFFATPDFARYLVGAAVAGVVGYTTIGFLIRMVSTRKVHWFALYCFVFGLVLIFFFPSARRTPRGRARAARGGCRAGSPRTRGRSRRSRSAGPRRTANGSCRSAGGSAGMQHREVDRVAREDRDQVLDPAPRRHARESIALRAARSRSSDAARCRSRERRGPRRGRGAPGSRRPRAAPRRSRRGARRRAPGSSSARRRSARPRLCSVTPRAISRSRRAPGEGLLEERDRLAQLVRGRAEVGERGREVVEGAGVPAALGVAGEVRRARRRRPARARRGRRRARGCRRRPPALWKKRARSSAAPKGEAGQQLPEVVGERARRVRVAVLAQLLLRAEPVAVGADRVGARARPGSASRSVVDPAFTDRNDTPRAVIPAAAGGAGSAK